MSRILCMVNLLLISNLALASHQSSQVNEIVSTYKRGPYHKNEQKKYCSAYKRGSYKKKPEACEVIDPNSIERKNLHIQRLYKVIIDLKHNINTLKVNVNMLEYQNQDLSFKLQQARLAPLAGDIDNIYDIFKTVDVISQDTSDSTIENLITSIDDISDDNSLDLELELIMALK